MDCFPSIPPSIPTAPSHDEPNESDTEKIMSDNDSFGDDVENNQTLPERIETALSGKSEGTIYLTEKSYEKAAESYRKSLEKLGKVSDVKSSDTVISQAQDVKLALNLNLALCYIKTSQWIEAARSSSAALNIDNNNIKALYRRGLARSRLGLLDEAKIDLRRVCDLDKNNIDARKELANLRDLVIAAKEAQKRSYSGIFDKTAGLYDDREKEMVAIKKKKKKN